MLEYDPVYNTWYCTNCGHTNNINDNICTKCKSNTKNIVNGYISPCTYCSQRFTCKGDKHVKY